MDVGYNSRGGPNYFKTSRVFVFPTTFFFFSTVLLSRGVDHGVSSNSTPIVNIMFYQPQGSMSNTVYESLRISHSLIIKDSASTLAFTALVITGNPKPFFFVIELFLF